MSWCVELLVPNRKFLGSDLVPEIGYPNGVVVLFVSPSKQARGWCFKFANEGFLLHHFQVNFHQLSDRLAIGIYHRHYTQRFKITITQITSLNCL